MENVKTAAASEAAEAGLPASENAAEPNSPSSDIRGAAALSQWWRRRSGFQKEALVFVALPTVLAFGYFALAASPMYESETKFAVRSGTETSITMDFASQFFRTANSTIQDAEIVDQYIRSPDVFEALDRKLKVVEHYSDRSSDVVSRLSANPSSWDKAKFWNCVAKPTVDPDTGIVTFTVRAYSPEMAHAVSSEVLALSEGLINEMNERARSDALKLAESEIKIARSRVAGAQKALEDFRDKHREMDPQAAASGLQSLVFELEGQRAQLKAQIEEAAGFMSSEAPQMALLKNRLEAVEKQLEQEKGRIVGADEENVLSAWVSEYETLSLEAEFARKQLTAAMAAFETARTTLLSKSRYIVPIEEPTMPDESRYPREFVFTLGIFLGLSLIYGMFKLIVASIREHAGF